MTLGGVYTNYAYEAVRALAGRLPWLDPQELEKVALTLLFFPMVAGIALLVTSHRAHRAVVVDEQGILFDSSPRFLGNRIAWEGVSGFRIVEGGVELRLRWRPWTRALGPRIPAVDRVAHELVLLLLESHGVPAY